MRNSFAFVFIFFVFVFSSWLLFRCNGTTGTEETVAEYERTAAVNSEIIAGKQDSILILRQEIRIRDAEILSLETKIRISKQIYGEIKQDFEVAGNHECDNIIGICDSLIDMQTAEIDTLKLQITDFKSIISLQYDIADTQREQIAAAEQVITHLEASIRRTWWERNVKWLMLAGGVSMGFAAGTAGR